VTPVSPSSTPSAAPVSPPAAARGGRGRLKLLLVLLVCASPVIASYLVYYFFPPQGRTNFGTLVEPQRPMPDLAVSGLDGQPQRFSSLLGQWVLLQVDSGECGKACADKLHALRQQRTMTGKERERIERVWLVTDSAVPSDALLREYGGTIVMRVDPAGLVGLLPLEPGRSPGDYLWVIDPMGNLMMRFPADGEPARIRKDIGRLLRASRVG
jgi:hypothetical protein